MGKYVYGIKKNMFVGKHFIFIAHKIQVEAIFFTASNNSDL